MRLLVARRDKRSGRFVVVGSSVVVVVVVEAVLVLGAVVVSTPQDIALLDAKKGLELFRKLNVPILGLVQNMSTFCCPNCGETTSIFGTDGVKKAAAELQIELLADVPLDATLREMTDTGKAAIIHAPDSAPAKAYRELAEAVQRKLEEKSEPLASIAEAQGSRVEIQ